MTSYKASQLDLIKTLAYNCNRCNYLWFPKDYDPPSDDIMKMEPPKSSARCKSKYWREMRIQDRIDTGNLARLRATHRRVKREKKEG
jgi:hypothetical protein